MKYLKLPKIGLMGLLMASGATAVASEMSYSYIEAAYIDTEIDNRNIDVDGDGVALGGSFAISDTFFLTAGYTTQGFDRGVDVDQWTFGVGGHLPLTDSVDFVGSLNYVDVDVDTRFGGADDDGIGATVGIRAKVAPMVELEGSISYVDFDDSGDSTSFGVTGRYYLTDMFALSAGVSVGDDVTGWQLGARYEFE